MIISYDSDKCGSELYYQLLAQDEILGLKLRAPRPDSKQRLGQKREHRLLPYHTPTRASSRIRFSGGTAGGALKTSH
jgi:hypothetical protein